MKSLYQTLFLLISIAFFTKAQEPDRSFKTSTITATGKRTALVIGNASYQYASPLKNPLNDANAMETTLKELGFEVKKLANANRSSLKEAINQWGQTLTNYDVALFFYAGHALEIDGTNFLCPVNANPLNRAQVEDETVTMRMVTGWMEEARTKTNIILLDACRDNPFRSFRSNEGGLANMSAPSGTFIGFAATPGKKASDGNRTNGLYTEAILKAIKTPNQTIDQCFNQVNAYVRQASQGTQVPFKNSSLENDFYFYRTLPETPKKQQVNPITEPITKPISNTKSGLTLKIAVGALGIGAGLYAIKLNSDWNTKINAIDKAQQSGDNASYQTAYNDAAQFQSSQGLRNICVGVAVVAVAADVFLWVRKPKVTQPKISLSPAKESVGLALNYKF